MDRWREYDHKLILIMILVFSGLWSFGHGDDNFDKEALLRLMQGFKNKNELNGWNESTDPCDGWQYVKCFQGNVTNLIIRDIILGGSIDAEALAGLTELRAVRFSAAGLSGNVPDLSKNTKLKNVYLDGNNFSGLMKDDMFDNMTALRVVWLNNSNISGPIPSSIVKPAKLAVLYLENNQFEGKIPPLNQLSLEDINVANNKLEGPVPKSLKRFNKSSFLGNSDLCGAPLDQACKSQKLKTWVIVVIVVAGVVGLLILSLLFLWCYKRRTKNKAGGRQPTGEESNSRSSYSPQSKIFPDEVFEMKSGSVEKYSSSMEAGGGYHVENKLVFFDGSKFELEELLRASAELMAKGSFGTVYRAILDNGSAIVVKRLREFCKMKEKEFDDYMQFLGKLRHQNLVTLKAYYGKEEKLLLYDFMPMGNLHSVLHGKRGPNRVPLDWKARLKIIRGVARGLAYLHRECGERLQVPHGHLKAANVLIDENMEARLCDFALGPLITSPVAVQKLVAYRAPEAAGNRQLLSAKADVWSFGVLLLEILTGKPPSHAPSPAGHAEGVDLPRYVNAIVREEWTGEVFDREISLARYAEGEMLQVLQLALSCADPLPGHRPEMEVLLKKIEQICERAEEVSSASTDTDAEGGVGNSFYDHTGEFSFSTNYTPEHFQTGTL